MPVLQSKTHNGEGGPRVSSTLRGEGPLSSPYQSIPQVAASGNRPRATVVLSGHPVPCEKPTAFSSHSITVSQVAVEVKKISRLVARKRRHTAGMANRVVSNGGPWGLPDEFDTPFASLGITSRQATLKLSVKWFQRQWTSSPAHLPQSHEFNPECEEPPKPLALKFEFSLRGGGGVFFTSKYLSPRRPSHQRKERRNRGEKKSVLRQVADDDGPRRPQRTVASRIVADGRTLTCHSLRPHRRKYGHTHSLSVWARVRSASQGAARCVSSHPHHVSL